MVANVDERALFVRGPVVVFKWRNEAGWPVEYVSANAEEVFGYSRQQFLDGDVAYGALIHPDDHERVGAEVAVGSLAEEGSFVHEPYRIIHADGSIRWLYDVTHVLQGEEPGLEGVSHFLGYVIDITDRMDAERERRTLERKILHTQKLESLGVLAGGVAHDFNNLLTGILGEASLAELDLRGGDDRIKRNLDNIKLLAQQAADLTQQLLAYSGRGHFAVEPVDLAELVRDTAGMLETVISKKAVLRLELDDVPPVDAGRAQMRQVLMNLITNASDALGDDAGTITIALSIAAEGACRDRPHERCVALSVSDTGDGMDDLVRAQIFDPFFSTKSEGRGLGMSAVLGIVRAQEGVIEVQSEPGRGTRFQLFFPASEHAAKPARPPQTTRRWRGNGVVLVVDDEPAVRGVALKMFEHFGFETLSAADGGEAIEVFTQNRARIRLALIDMTMPVLGGIETLDALRTLEPELPAILSSGYTEEDVLEQMTRPDITVFLHKPYQLRQFEDIIRLVLPEG